MENQTLYFYSIQIGRRTKRGGFIAEHSFVCKTENHSVGDVMKHYLNQYKGFEINVAPVTDVIPVDISSETKIDFMGRTKREKDLEKELNLLKKKKSKLRIDNKIDPGKVNSDVIRYMDKMGKIMRRYRQFQKIVKEEIRSHLEKKYGAVCREIIFKEDITHSKNEYVNYQVVIAGDLITE